MPLVSHLFSHNAPWNLAAAALRARSEASGSVMWSRILDGRLAMPLGSRPAAVPGRLPAS